MLQDGFTPLHAAAAKGHASVVTLLLATPGVDPLAACLSDGETPLDWALESDYITAERTAALLHADPRVAAALAAAGDADAQCN